MSDVSDSMFSVGVNGIPDAGSNNWIFYAVSLLLMGGAFVLSLGHDALEYSSVSNQKDAAEKNEKGALSALGLISRQDRYLHCSSVGLHMMYGSGVVLLWIALLRSSCGFAVQFIRNQIAAALTGGIISFVLLLIVCYSLICLVPQNIARNSPDRILRKLSGFFRLLCVIFLPAAAVSRLLAVVVLKLTGQKPKLDSSALTEEEILMMVDEGEETGLIEENTKDIIENIFDFDDTTVGEIMTHRKDIAAVRDDALIDDVVKTALKSGNSRIPVYHEDIDDIVGIIHVKEILRFVGQSTDGRKIDQGLIKEAIFVPESKRCSEMFEYMNSQKTQIAIVVDEFGGTGGIITMEDLIESILGSIQDEYDNEDEEIQRIDDSHFTVDGATSLDEIADLTGLDLSNDANDTIAGVMLDRMGHIPKSGEHPSVMISGVRFTVQEVRDRRISKVLIVKGNMHRKDDEKKN